MNLIPFKSQVNTLLLVLTCSSLMGCNEFSSSQSDNANTDEEQSPAISIVITSVQNGDYINIGNQDSFSISGNCNVASDISFNNGEGLISCDGTGFSGQLDLSGLNDGPVLMTASLMDTETGEMSSSSVSLLKDTELPSLVMGEPNLSTLNSSAVAVLPITVSGGENFVLSTQDFSLTGDTQDCSLAVLNGSTATPSVEVSGCTFLNGNIQIELGTVEITDLAGNTVNTVTMSTTLQIDNFVPFVAEYRIDSSNLSLDLPLKDGFNYDFTINWGDGTPEQVVTSFDDLDKVHTYSNAGDFTVTINGVLESFGDADSVAPYKNQILNIPNLGNTGLKDLSSAFSETSILNSVSGGNLSEVINMSGAFSESSIASLDTSSWDTAKVENMAFLFHDIDINPDVSSFDMSSAKTINFMFADSPNIQPVTTNWDTSNVTNMSNLFDNCPIADPDVSNWDTSNVENMSAVFFRADAANPDVSNWDTSNVTLMIHMFYLAVSANPDLTNWDVSKVRYFNSMFRDNPNINPDISGWDVSSAISMYFMFDDATAFDRDLSGWDVTNLSTCTSFSNNTSPNWTAAEKPNFINCTE